MKIAFDAPRRLPAALLGLALAAPLLAQEEPDAAAMAPSPEAAPEPARSVSVEEAYAREFAFLEAERRQLLKRIEETRQRNAQLQADLRNEVDGIQTSVVTLTSRLDRLQEQIGQSEEQAMVNADNREVLAATFQQAGATLEQEGMSGLESESFQDLDDASKVEVLFDDALALVRKLGTIRREQGEFYLTDGSEAIGTVLRVGNIAAYGQAGDNAGVLAPAGGGRLKIWPETVGNEVRQLMAGQGGEVIPVFLFESLTNAIEARKSKTPVDVINDGGTIGWVIVILGLIGLLMIILRVVFLKRAGASIDKLTDQIAPMVRAGNASQAVEFLRGRKSAPARVMAAAVRNLDKDRDHLEDIVSEEILHESATLNRFGTAILVIAAVAPLLGLLGTVTGMIATFDIITEFGTGDPKLLSGGIAIALVTTELGLIVAIPTLLVGNLLSGWAEGIKDDMEKAALHIINISQDRKRELKAVA